MYVTYMYGVTERRRGRERAGGRDGQTRVREISREMRIGRNPELLKFT